MDRYYDVILKALAIITPDLTFNRKKWTKKSSYRRFVFFLFGKFDIGPSNLCPINVVVIRWLRTCRWIWCWNKVLHSHFDIYNNLIAILNISYVTPVSALQKWFPHRRGLAAGFGVCGFGGGSIVIGKVILPLIKSVGLPLTFVVLGSCYFFAMMCTAFLFRVPPPGYSVCTDDSDNVEKKEKLPVQPEIKLTAAESIKSFDYLLLYVMLFANILFGLVVISRLSNMITQLFLKDPDEAATMVSVNGALNLFGRLFFSTLSDKIGRKPCFIIMLTAQTIIVATFSLYTEEKIYWAFLLCMFTLTMCYGGKYFETMPTFTKNFKSCLCL